jgi:shikimate kinase
LPLVAQALNRTAIDLDEVLSRQRPLREWVVEDVLSFRAAERSAFRHLPRGCVVSVGGGFLAAHAPVLVGCVVVLVPVTFETYVERLRRDTTRPRLRPELSVDAELREVFAEREDLHRDAHPTSFVDFALKLQRGLRARRVVTAPPGVDVLDFAWRARHLGADVLELRTDTTPPTLDLRPVRRALPVLVADRGNPLPQAWLRHAEIIDVELHEGASAAEATLCSYHAPRAMRPAEVLAHWSRVPHGVRVKHVEPLEQLSRAAELLQTQAALIERFGEEHVTVLATGPMALPVRARLAQRNALEYLAVDSAWAAAPGQRLVADAVREARFAQPGVGRLGILGGAIAHSRSPRIHTQPFDRIELPAEADMRAVLDGLHASHRGLAVTNPFKKPVAQALGTPEAAVNTVVRTSTGWAASNTDEFGAQAVLEALNAKEVSVLGNGGATEALRLAAHHAGITLMLHPHNSRFDHPLSGAVVWTWPAAIEAPNGLRFTHATVAVIAYGPPGRQIGQRIRALGGTPRFLGPRWFIAQARRQKALWEHA